MNKLKNMPAIHEFGLVPLFAYGTLRPGYALNGWIEDITVEVEHATVDGFALTIPEGGWYPKMVPERGQMTTGEIAWVREGSQLARLIEMEMRAGYDLELVDALTDTLNISLPCLSFIWNGAAHGKQVRHNDWANHAG